MSHGCKISGAFGGTASQPWPAYVDLWLTPDHESLGVSALVHSSLARTKRLLWSQHAVVQSRTQGTLVYLVRMRYPRVNQNLAIEGAQDTERTDAGSTCDGNTKHEGYTSTCHHLHTPTTTRQHVTATGYIRIYEHEQLSAASSNAVCFDYLIEYRRRQQDLP